MEIIKGYVSSANGSALVRSETTSVLCVIKGELSGSPESEFFLNASSVPQEETRLNMLGFLKSTIGRHLEKILPKLEGGSGSGFSWKLYLDVMVLDELDLSQIGLVGTGIRAALEDTALPAVSVFQ